MTARAIRLLWLGAPADPAVDALALAAVEAIEDARARRELLAAALEALHSQTRALSRLRQQLAATSDGRRALGRAA